MMINIDGHRISVERFMASKGLQVQGWLDLSGTGITALPEGLSVGGSLDLRGTGITALPEGLSVGGSLYLRGTGITALPEGLSVAGSLDLRDCPNLTGVFRVGKDRRGYEFFGVRLANGWRVIAGCRNFSAAEAREHWAGNRECLALAERVIAAEPGML
ncbi:MAG TPA: hypothetical protein VN702_17795 [Acetobacteraceae bacterium]|nr:hypothetical protein [Acetobacteraceae bacterium]